MKYIKLYFLMMLGLAVLTTIFFPIETTEAYPSEQILDISTTPAKNFLNMEKLAPGDIITETLIINNKGKVDFENLINAAKEQGNQNLYDQIEVTILKDGTSLYKGKLAELKEVPLGQIAAASNNKIEFKIRLPLEADNTIENKSTVVDFKFLAKSIYESRVGEVLANTATNKYNLLFIGILTMDLGILLYYINKRQLYEKEL